MYTIGKHTYSEIVSQPDAWADAISFLKGAAGRLTAAWRQAAPKQVIFIGCGSTFYLSQSAAKLFQGLTGIPAAAHPSSELLLFPGASISQPEETLMMAISRSGTTTETLVAIDHFRKIGGKAVWGITCYPEESMAKMVDEVLLAEAAQEISVAQTRSFASMLVLAQGFAALVAGQSLDALDRLPGLGRKLIEAFEPMAKSLGESPELERFYFLGSGVQYGLANETMLKMKEMSLSYSEGYHFMEFRHGPKSMINRQTLVLGLLSRDAHPHETKVLSEIREMGGKVVSFEPAAVDLESDYQVHLDQEIAPWALPVLYLPVLQLLAFYRAVSRGYDPDNPRNLTSVVFLDADAF